MRTLEWFGFLAAAVWLPVAAAEDLNAIEASELAEPRQTTTPASKQEAWRENVRNAGAKIRNLRKASLDPDPTAFRRAAFELKADPVAVELLNQESADLLTEAEKMHLRAKVNELTMDIRESTKAAARTRIAETYNAQRGFKPGDPGFARAEDVSFFEATNPPKPGQVEKVKMDWDMTPRVHGKDVGGSTYEAIVEEEF
ncbi:MAG: hypothetical protein JXB04_00320, partial [Kiritimatiellae bacterium]|nr:hypothetical protein [Kiritimatiellia bacterium]